MSVSKRTVMVIKSNTFQQRNLENNYLETNIQKDNYFGPAPCQSCMSCQSKSAGKPTSKPARKPASQQADQQVASQQASSQQARSCQRGPAAVGEALEIMKRFDYSVRQKIGDPGSIKMRKVFPLIVDLSKPFSIAI